MDKESPEEKLKKVEIQAVEKECLDRVFAYISKFFIKLVSLVKQTPSKERAFEEKISASDLMRVLNAYGEKPTKAEVELMIWEVDDDLDKHVSQYEFEKMYKRCIADK